MYYLFIFISLSSILSSIWFKEGDNFLVDFTLKNSDGATWFGQNLYLEKIKIPVTPNITAISNRANMPAIVNEIIKISKFKEEVESNGKSQVYDPIVFLQWDEFPLMVEHDSHPHKHSSKSIKIIAYFWIGN